MYIYIYIYIYIYLCVCVSSAAKFGMFAGSKGFGCLDLGAENEDGDEPEFREELLKAPSGDEEDAVEAFSLDPDSWIKHMYIYIYI